MINPISQSGARTYNVNNYVVDTEDDIKDLPGYSEMGSTARVISTGDLYILNSKKEWIKQPRNAGAGNSSSGEGDIQVLNDAPSSTGDSIVIL